MHYKAVNTSDFSKQHPIRDRKFTTKKQQYRLTPPERSTTCPPEKVHPRNPHRLNRTRSQEFVLPNGSADHNPIKSLPTTKSYLQQTPSLKPPTPKPQHQPRHSTQTPPRSILRKPSLKFAPEIPQPPSRLYIRPTNYLGTPTDIRDLVYESNHGRTFELRDKSWERRNHDALRRPLVVFIHGAEPRHGPLRSEHVAAPQPSHVPRRSRDEEFRGQRELGREDVWFRRRQERKRRESVEEDSQLRGVRRKSSGFERDEPRQLAHAVYAVYFGPESPHNTSAALSVSAGGEGAMCAAGIAALEGLYQALRRVRYLCERDAGLEHVLFAVDCMSVVRGFVKGKAEGSWQMVRWLVRELEEGMGVRVLVVGVGREENLAKELVEEGEVGEEDEGDEREEVDDGLFAFERDAWRDV